jgi:hypothetical protein
MQFEQQRIWIVSGLLALVGSRNPVVDAGGHSLFLNQPEQ